MADSLQTIDNYDKVETINKNRIRKKKIMAEHIEYLKLTPGFRTALADGVLVPDSPKHMTTWEFYRAVPGSRIHLCKEGYLFAPAIFSMERNPVYLYSYAYQPEENWASYTQNLTPDSYCNRDYIFKEDCWFRLCVKREDGEELTTTDCSQAEELVAFFCEDICYKEKPWFSKKIQSVARHIKEIQNNHTMKLCLLTDTHYTINGTWEDTAHNIQKMSEEVSYDAIIHLGDLTDGMTPKEITRKYVNHIISDLQKCQVPVYITPGNHDSNYFRNRQNMFLVKEMKELYGLYGDGDDKYGVEKISEEENSINYYIDMPQYSVRMIFLSSFDDMAAIRYGYTDNQLVWLKHVLSGAEYGTRFLIFSHDAPLAKLDYWSFYVRNGEKLLDILEEYNSQEMYQIVGFFYGHTHSDYVFEECSFPIISTGCAKLEYMLEKKPEGAITHYRESDTISQELWDSLLIDFEEQKIKMVRFGAGADREVSFKKKKDSYRMISVLQRLNRNPKIWAHRGASGHAPENTIPAFELACMMGADGIELDVQLSKDGIPVVIHDETIDRVSNQTGWVKDFTLEQLKTLNVNKYFPAYGRVEIPTLSEVYDLMKKTDLTINLELKNTIIFYKDLEEIVLRLAEEKGLSDRIIYSSFNHNSIRRIQKLKPEARTGFLYSDGILDVAEYGAKYGVYALHPSVRNIRCCMAERQYIAEIDGDKKADILKEKMIGARYPDIIRQCHNRNIRVHVWAVNEMADFEWMKELGVDAVITDFIERG